jgi:GNAT superfamily N-acetyltransferase
MKSKLQVYPRSDGVEYPQIYSTFKVKTKNNNDDVEEIEEELHIRDLVESEFDEAVDFIVEFHARGSIFHRAAKTLSTEEGIKKVRAMYRKVFEEKVSLICVKAETNEIIGINAMLIKYKSDELPYEPDDNIKFQLLTDAKNYIENSYNVMEHYDVDRYMFTAGLCVHRKYRCKGIGTQILKARIPLMKAIDVNVTVSIFSTIGAQNAAVAAGFINNYEITYEELEAKFPAMDFSHAYGTSCKLSSLKV